MKLAIVVLNYNGQTLLRTFLPDIVRHTPDADIYVIDNASTDGSLELLQAFPQVHIIALDHNKGYAGGYNEGLKQVQADVLCLINSDVQVSAHWVLRPLQLFQEDEHLAAVQPKIRSYHNKAMFEYAGAAGGFLDFLGYPYCRGRVLDSVESDVGQYDNEVPIFWASGACFFVRKKYFDEVGGFDEEFFAHQEEIDLCWRFQLLGKRVCFTHLSLVYHVGGATLGADNPQKTYLNFRNNLCMLLKNLPLSQVFFVVFVRLCLDGVAGLKFLLEGQAAHTWAIVRAHFAFYKHSVSMWRKRWAHTPPIERKPWSILYHYWVKTPLQ